MRDWAQTLRFFRFCRAVPGGHAADGDTLRLAFKDEALPRRLTRDFPAVDGAGRHMISGVPVNIGFGDGKLWLSLSGAAGNPYAVTKEDIDNALEVENMISSLSAHIIDPPIDSPFCIAPEFWPEFWISSS